MIRYILFLWVACFFSITAQISENSFDVLIKSKMNFQFSDGTLVHLNGETNYRYRIHKENAEVKVYIESVGMYMEKNNKEMMNFRIAENHLSYYKGAPGENFRKKITPPLKEIMDAGFGHPLYKIVNSGKREKIIVLAGPKASPLLDNGIVANTRLFHSVFAENTKWQAPVKLSMGSNQYAKGNLNYQKISDKKIAKEYVPVKVFGELSSKTLDQGGPIKARDFLYKVVGSQLYQKQKQEWAQGQWQVEVTFHMTNQNKKYATVSGTMNITMQSNLAPKSVRLANLRSKVEEALDSPVVLSPAQTPQTKRLKNLRREIEKTLTHPVEIKLPVNK